MGSNTCVITTCIPVDCIGNAKAVSLVEFFGYFSSLLSPADTANFIILGAKIKDVGNLVYILIQEIHYKDAANSFLGRVFAIQTNSMSF